MGTQLTSKISIASFHEISASRESHVTMSILKYIHPISCFDDELSCSVPTATIKEVNHRVLEVQKNGKKRGQYSKFSDNKKALIGKYASQHGVSRVVKHFTDMMLKESTVRDWRNLYLKQLKAEIVLAKSGEVEVKSLKMKKCGRPPLLGKNMDNHLQKIITAMKSRGTPIGTNMVCAVAKGTFLKHGKPCVDVNDGKEFSNKEWARSVLHRMGFLKR